MRRCQILLFALVTVLVSARCVAAEEVIWTTGRVLDAGSGRPIGDAVVAVYDQKQRVVDYARTDADGYYALAVLRSALALKGKSSGGFLHEVTAGVSRFVGGVGRVAALPLKVGIKVAASAAGASDPLIGAGVGVVPAWPAPWSMECRAGRAGRRSSRNRERSS